MRRFNIIIYFVVLLKGFYGVARGQSIDRTSHGVHLITDSQNIRIQFFAGDIVRIFKSPVGVTVDKKSFAVIKQPEKVHFQLRRTGNSLNMIGDSLEVQVNLKSGRIAFFTPLRKQLLSEKENGTHFTTCSDTAEHAFKVTQSFKLTANEAIYGLG